MAHPHEHLLAEYKVSIDRLVPLTPDAVREEAEKLYQDLRSDEHVTDRQIRQALIHIGKKEFPYRKAYEALCATDEEKRLEASALKRLDGELVKKLEDVMQHGVHLLDYTKSKLFETNLSPEEKYRVDQAILAAHDDINRQCDERAQERHEKYEELVSHWTKEGERMQALIDQLRSMAERDPKWSGEILGKVEQFEEGWSIVERDPSFEEIQKEIENWSAVFEESDGEEEV